MPGSSNFQQWNPNQSNQETDAAYTADALRQAGAANPSILPSATANKLFYQVSTFVAAFAQALAGKGYTVTDANLNSLAAALAAVMTQADMVPYAQLANPNFSGTPTTPTPPGNDNSNQIANTAWIRQQAYLTGITTGMVLSALGFTPVQQGGGANQGPNKVFLGWDGARMRVQVDATDQGELAWLGDLAPYAPLNSPSFQGTPGTTTPPAGDSTGRIPNTIWVTSNFAQLSQLAGSAASPGYQRFPSGLLMQWGNAAVPNSGSLAVNYPVAFASGPFCIQVTDNGSAGGNNDYVCSAGVGGSPTTQFTIYVKNSSGSYTGASVGWFAVGH